MALQQSLKLKHITFIILLLVLLLVLGVICSLVFGSRSLTLNQVVDGLFHGDQSSFEASIVQKRLVRTVFGLCCGAALGIAGVLMQSVTRNPLADPSILGVNTGASLFVVCGMSFLNMTNAYHYIWLALLGSFVVAAIVFGIGSLGRGGATPLKLVLAGAATTAALTSLLTAIMIPRSFVMDQFRFWQVGSIGAGNWDSIVLMLPFFVVGIITAILSIPSLNALALGEETATSLGVKTSFVKIVVVCAGVMLCGATTAVAGPIAFVGLLATHVMRLIVGSDLRLLLPLSAIAGSTILVISDVIGRLIGQPGELEVGVLTAFIGAPILIILAMKAKVRAL